MLNYQYEKNSKQTKLLIKYIILQNINKVINKHIIFCVKTLRQQNKNTFSQYKNEKIMLC